MSFYPASTRKLTKNIVPFMAIGARQNNNNIRAVRTSCLRSFPVSPDQDCLNRTNSAPDELVSILVTLTVSMTHVVVARTRFTIFTASMIISVAGINGCSGMDEDLEDFAGDLAAERQNRLIMK